MPYIYRVTRREPARSLTVQAVAKPVELVEPAEAAAVEPSYRDLQAQAKALGISGKQKAGKLKKAIREANSG